MKPESNNQLTRLCSPGMRRLVLRLGLAAEDQIKKIEHQACGRMLLAALADAGMLNEDSALEKVAKDLSLPLVQLNDPVVVRRYRKSSLLARFDHNFAQKYCCVPLEEKEGTVVVVMADPLDGEAIAALKFMLGGSLQIALGKEKEILALLSKYADSRLMEEAAASAQSDSRQGGSAESESEDSEQLMMAGSESAPVVRLVQKILNDAVEQQASDIHLEPGPESLDVRFRVDGVLGSHTMVPKNLQNYVLTRLKILSGMDITIRRRPQDGRFTLRSGQNAGGDARVSSVPTPYGEKLVVRLLQTGITGVSLEELGMPPEMLAQFAGVLAARDRMVIVTGPTGSGKSTTLYAAIMTLQNGAHNIITVEDPIEYRIEGITQMQVDQKSGMTFASGLRSILRQDPDIIMVGEIRDAETAQIGFQAAQTGHLVLTTLHTNSAASAVVRLLDLGIEPYIISASLGAVLAQRLVRRLCSFCCRELSEAEAAALSRNCGIAGPNLRAAVGCPQCENTGYGGRIGLYSLLVINAEMRELIRQGASEAQLEENGNRYGLLELTDSGRKLVEQGVTTIEEMERVLGKTVSPGKTAAETNISPPAATGGEVSTMDELLGSFISGVEGVLEHEPLRQKPGEVSCAPGAADGDETSVTELARTYRLGASPAAARQRVLLVDDDDGVRFVIARALSKAGYEVCEAVDGIDALEKLESFAPNIIVSDLLMPRLDGEEFALRLRVLDKTRSIPLIVLSASDSDANEIRLLQSGASDFVSKASSPAVLIARIQKLLRT